MANNNIYRPDAVNNIVNRIIKQFYTPLSNFRFTGCENGINNVMLDNAVQKNKNIFSVISGSSRGVLCFCPKILPQKTL